MKFWQNYEFYVIKLRAKKHQKKTRTKTKQKQKQNKAKNKQKTKTPPPPPNKKNKCILIGSCEESSEQFLAISWRRQAQFSLGG
jgi:hypothetical protein